MNIKNQGEKIFNAFQEGEIVKINKVTFKNKKIINNKFFSRRCF